jgi:outer membrane cobalamin receptor
VKDTSTPIDFFAGIKLKPIYNLLFDAYVDYSAIDNQYFFFNKEYDFSLFNSSIIASNFYTLYTNKFDVLYSKATHLKVGMRANYNIRRVVNVELKGAYNGWHVNSEQYAWNKPKWEANLNTDVYLTHDLSISANLFYEGERYAKLGTMAMRMRPKVDINLGASYSTNSWFTAFAKINNLINNPYEMYYGYQVQGINALVGVAFSF